jgi:alpha-1,2-mannosyltransferase
LGVSTISISRTTNLIRNFDGTFRVYTDLSLNSDRYEESFLKKYNQINVCVGKEWYRFPNSYFFPNERYNLTFIRQIEKNSQLPQYFGSSTSEILPNFNDKNEDELSRYIGIEKCHFVIDLDSEEKRKESFSSDNWELLSEFSFIDSSNSPSLTRAYYIPLYSSRKNRYISYFLLRNRKM